VRSNAVNRYDSPQGHAKRLFARPEYRNLASDDRAIVISPDRDPG
jgi:hypothetical protein